MEAKESCLRKTLIDPDVEKSMPIYKVLKGLQSVANLWVTRGEGLQGGAVHLAFKSH